MFVAFQLVHALLTVSGALGSGPVTANFQMEVTENPSYIDVRKRDQGFAKLPGSVATIEGADRAVTVIGMTVPDPSDANVSRYPESPRANLLQRGIDGNDESGPISKAG